MSLARKITALIVDDEWLSRSRVREVLQNDSDIEILGECANGNEAVEAIRQMNPEIVFMDMQMPGMNGLEVAQSLDPENRPLIIFATAYDSFAIHAFEVQALDYILKPFDSERLEVALRRAKLRIMQNRTALHHPAVLTMKQIDQPADKRLAVKNDGTVVLLKIQEIDWIEAQGNRVEIHAGEKSYHLRQGINELHSRLDANIFARIHRSTIVNIQKIAAIQSRFHGDLLVILQNGKELLLSRNYRDSIRDLLKRSSALHRHAR